LEKYNNIAYPLKLWLITCTVSYWLCMILLLFSGMITASFESMLNGFINSIGLSLGFLIIVIILTWGIRQLNVPDSTKKFVLIVVGSPLCLSADAYRELLDGKQQVPILLLILSALVYTIVFAMAVIYFKLPSAIKSYAPERGIIIPFRRTKNAGPI
jgi:hypothetical protein